MSVSVFQVARKICDLSNWEITNLKLQKIIYLTHMVYAGKYGKPLIKENFEAWAYGPVVPELYHKAKIFGSKPIHDILGWKQVEFDAEKEKFIKEAWDYLGQKTPSQLVSMTHKQGGAWEKNYNPHEKGVVIPLQDIIEEYKSES